jgi:hypothetical protein
MKIRSLVLSVALLAGLSASARTQTVEVQLPTLTEAQKWNRMEFHWSSLIAGAIAYAKSKGEGVESLGHFMGKLFAPSWGDTLSPAGLIRGLYRNGAAWKDFQLQVVTATQTSVTARFNRPWVPDFGTSGNLNGSTPADVDTLLRIVYEEIATAHGLVYEERRDGEHVVVTVRRR